MSKKTKRVAIALITDSHDNILMGKRNDNDKWCNPGGHLHEKEDPFWGMVRELKEETGLKARQVRMIKVEKKDGLILYLFKVTVDPNQQADTSKDPDEEVDEWIYVDPNNIKNNLHIPIENNIALKYWIEN